MHIRPAPPSLLGNALLPHRLGLDTALVHRANDGLQLVAHGPICRRLEVSTRNRRNIVPVLVTAIPSAIIVTVATAVEASQIDLNQGRFTTRSLHRLCRLLLPLIRHGLQLAHLLRHRALHETVPTGRPVLQGLGGCGYGSG